MISVFQQHWQELLVGGFGNTLLCSVIALFFSLIIGSTFAIFEVLPSRFLHILGRVYIEVFRNIPLLVIGMFFYAVVPQYVVSINGFTAGTIGLTLYTSAFIAETVRAGIQAVDEGQMEGARLMDLPSCKRCGRLSCHKPSDM